MDAARAAHLVSEAHLNGAQAFKTAVEAAGGPASAQQPQAQTGGLPPGKPPLGPPRQTRFPPGV
jgi:hypothetical protein